MTKDEALKLALEALELTARDYREQRHAITAIREVLAQPEQEPMCAHGIGKTKCGFCHQPQPEQEPVNKYCCHLCFNKSGQMFLDRMLLCPECGNKRCPKATYHELPCTNSNEPNQPGSIYTTPPHRKPLTDVEIWNTYKNLWMFHPAEEPRLAGDVLKFARAIEAAHGIKE